MPVLLTCVFVQGAAIMNNSFCLGIFLMIIYAKKLVWEFSAETLSILLVEVCGADACHSYACIPQAMYKRKDSHLRTQMQTRLHPISM